MTSMLRWLVALLVLAVVACAGLFIAAGRSAPPVLSIDLPQRIGQQGILHVSASAPHAKFTELSVVVEQAGRTIPLFTLERPQSATVSQASPDLLRLVRPFGKQTVPELQPGAARIVVAASRRSFLDLREVASTASREVVIALDPPKVAVVSTHHYVNHGGSEMVVYRVTPPDVSSGVRVGEIEFRGFPASSAGGTATDPPLKVAFFALLHDQDLRAPIAVFARDEAGNEATAAFIDNVFEKPFTRSRIDVDDRFFARVVPETLVHSPEIQATTGGGDLLPDFLRLNGELRRLNADRITMLTATSSPTRLWKGPFAPLGNAQVEARFADNRTYFYNGKEVDRQVHLGFDLAVTSAVPVLAGNDGVVVNASWLGIYGNCVILDHGLGVASLYGHLSAIDVRVGDRVTKGQPLGRSGMTGLAGGDHLHFTMLVDGHPVSPVEWWDSHWMEDRVERKFREAAGETRPSTPRAVARPDGQTPKRQRLPAARQKPRTSAPTRRSPGV